MDGLVYIFNKIKILNGGGGSPLLNLLILPSLSTKPSELILLFGLEGLAGYAVYGLYTVLSITPGRPSASLAIYKAY